MRPPAAPDKSLPRRLSVPVEAFRNGHLRQGLDALVKVFDEKNWLDRILMGYALLHTKGPSHAERVLKRAIEEPQLTPALRAMAYSTLGTAFGYRNRFGEAVKSLERALHFALKTDDIHLIAEVQLGLLASKVDCFGPAAVGTLISEALRSVQNSGDPQLLALLHFRVSIVEGRRGAKDVALRHIELGLNLLKKAPNPWIESSLHLAGSAVSFVASDLTGALTHAERSIALAKHCGGLFNQLAARSNASQICVVLGRFTEAAKHIEAAEPAIQEFPFLRFCIYDNLAQMQLATGDLSGCHDTLQALANQLAQNEEEAASFPQLDSATTRARLLHKQGRLNEAEALAQETSLAAQSRGERVLETALLILHAEILVDQGRLDEASALASKAAETVTRTGSDSLSTRAELERVRGKILHKLGASKHAVPVLERAIRMHASIGDSVAHDAAKAIIAQLPAAPAPVSASAFTSPTEIDDALSPTVALIESMTTLSSLGAHADLLAGEAYETLLASGAVERLALIAITDAPAPPTLPQQGPQPLPQSQAVPQSKPEPQQHQARSPQQQLVQSHPLQAKPTQTHSPQMQVPQAQGPQVQSPQAQSPQAQGPQVQSPQAQSPQAQSPQAQSLQTRSPHLQTPQMDAQVPTILRQHNWPDADLPIGRTNMGDVIWLSLGKTKDREFVLLVQPKPSFVARSGLSALHALIRMAISREEHRRERVRQESVWPAERYADHPGALFVGRRMADVVAQAMKVAKSPLTILLTGETGVGKEVLAREIHQLSLRSQQIFQPVVCAGMPSGLLESQLFGHKKGSFTGAVSDFPGVIRAAQGGTLFLDEIGELSNDLQIKLLRFLESKEIHPIGELRPIKVDVRVIAATNADLHQMVQDGKFREDLFYRLNVATFNIPPLRERLEEIPSLVQHFLAQYSQQNHKPVPGLSDETLEYLLLYRWPGNVRELKNEMERLAGMTDAAGIIEPSDLKSPILAARKTVPSEPGPHEVTIRMNQPLHEAIDHLEKEMIRHVLTTNQDNLESAARALGLSRKGLYHKRQRLGIF
jgi:DNA-binding NtrC family response regulator/tetratricopeptide (TPR) repeat protein